MSHSKNSPVKRVSILLISFAFIFLFRYMPPIPMLTASGMQVLGVFLGVLTLWLTVAIDWPSLLCLGALALVPELSMDGLLRASFGNSTIAFLMFTFLCTFTLSQTPFIRRCAVGFVTSGIAKRGPWMFSALFFASVIFIGSFISPTVLFVIYLPIIEEIYAVLGLKKGSTAASMLMVGLVICCGVSCGMTPIAHVFPLMALGFFTAATGHTITYTSYMAFAVPVGLVTFVCMLLIFRFIMRPDMGEIKSGDVDSLRKNAPPMDRREISVLAVFGIVVFLWIAPDLTAPLFPGFSKLFKGLGAAMPPLIGVAALSVITFGGKPLLNFGEGMSKGVPWGALIMSVGTLALGSALTNANVGIVGTLGGALGPIAAKMAPFAMVALFTAWAAVQTNVSSNMVTVTVVTAIAIPICLAANGAVSTSAVCAMIGMIASYAFAFPSAMPCVAIAGASGWTTAGTLARIGSLMAITATIIAVLLGYPIASALMP